MYILFDLVKALSDINRAHIVLYHSSDKILSLYMIYYWTKLSPYRKSMTVFILTCFQPLLITLRTYENSPSLNSFKESWSSTKEEMYLIHKFEIKINFLHITFWHIFIRLSFLF